MEDTNLQELQKIKNVTNREWILWFGERCSDLRSQIAKNWRNHVTNRHFYTKAQSRRQAQQERTSKTGLHKRKQLLKKKV